ncbi:MAG: hypothetical protein ACYCS1_03545 [Gammaproteobacteria bacterium]
MMTWRLITGVFLVGALILFCPPIVQARLETHVSTAGIHPSSATPKTNHVRKNQCDSAGSHDNDLCVCVAFTHAQSARKVDQAITKGHAASADVRAGSQRKNVDKRYQETLARCNTLNGRAKDACVADVKARYEHVR